MRLPNRPATLDDTSGYDKNQQNLINAILNSLYQSFTSSIMKQVEEDEPLVQMLGTNHSSTMTNLIDRVYNSTAFLSFTLHNTGNTITLFQIKDDYTVNDIRWNGIGSSSTNYYVLNNYASMSVISYNNHSYLLFTVNKSLPVNTWTVTMSLSITENGKNYDSPVINKDGVKYYVSSDNDKFKQAKLNASLDSIQNIIYNFVPDKTEQEYHIINEEDSKSISVNPSPSNPVYLVGNYNGIPLRLGTLLQNSTSVDIQKINTEDTDISEYSWTITNSSTQYTEGTFYRNNVDYSAIGIILSTYGISSNPITSGKYNIEYTVKCTGSSGSYYNYSIVLDCYKVKNLESVDSYKLIQFYR